MTAPPAAAWYHGPLSRAESEAHIREHGSMPGQYLIRDSTREPGFGMIKSINLQRD